jgi:serine/threonine protein kinase
MNEPMRCETCGATLSRPAPGSWCPRCLLRVALESDGEEVDETSPSPILKSGLTIGQYRVLRLIGTGAMGAVYEAWQEQPRRVVALKLFKPGLMSLELLRRFERESRALGRLQHPGIAQVYEAGTADTGFGPQPYFAMELIRGENLLEYVEKHQLATRQRLEIVVRVCEAVHHAHQRDLIHRDLKPANILVDEAAQPKILDFGVAHLTNSETQTSLQTTVGQLVGTLAYMSPEQALADPLALDTRSDVYALGVILYQLLSGRLPYKFGKSMPEALRVIREEDPAPLGTFDPNYRGNIETIVAKALEKDKARRYSSAAELSSDLQRHLRDEPISARPPGAGYQLRKFLRRNWNTFPFARSRSLR